MAGTSRQPPLCIILCPPWVRSGSANVFAAQTRAYLDLGYDVAVLAVPHDRALASNRDSYWKTVESEFRFAPDQQLFINRSTDRRRRFTSPSYWRWLGAGRGTVMAVDADVAAHSRPGRDCAEMLRDRPVRLIHVNHCINMGLARRLAQRSARRHGEAPALILETHDIQVERYRLAGLVNPFTGRADAERDLARDEAALCSGAAALVHLTPRDHRHFASLLPDRAHFLVRPAIGAAPAGPEAPGRPPQVDFAYIGNGHHVNAESIAWFASQVMPLLKGSGLEIRIAGSVEAAVRQSNPMLHAAHARLWLGEVASVHEVYSSARFVIAPTVASSGISIKIIEAMAMGKFIVASPAAMAAFEGIDGMDDAVVVADGAAAFAAAMRGLASDGAPFNQAGRSVYERAFSYDRYVAQLSAVARYADA